MPSYRPKAHGHRRSRRQVSGLLGTDSFFDLLRRRNARNAGALDRRLEGRHLQELAVLMSDSSGFSRKTHEYGILQFLAVMTRCYDRLIPLIESRRGLCLSHNADNILAVFADPADAIRAAADMHRWLRRRNKGLPDRERFNVCIGIHFGSVFRLRDNVFGDRVNVAAKMGEDLASADEILVTKDVAERVRGKIPCEYSRSTEIGGRTFELYRVPYR